MSGTLSELGLMSVGQANPLLGLTGAQLTASATLALGEVQGKLTGLLALIAQLSLPQVPALAIAGAGAPASAITRVRLAVAG